MSGIGWGRRWGVLRVLVGGASSTSGLPGRFVDSAFLPGGILINQNLWLILDLEQVCDVL